MENIRITLEKETRLGLEKIPGKAENKGDIRSARRIMAIFAASEGIPSETIALTLGVMGKTLTKRIGIFLCEGPEGLKSEKSPGRRSEAGQNPEKRTCRYYRKRTCCRGVFRCLPA